MTSGREVGKRGWVDLKKFCGFGRIHSYVRFDGFNLSGYQINLCSQLFTLQAEAGAQAAMSDRAGSLCGMRVGLISRIGP